MYCYYWETGNRQQTFTSTEDSPLVLNQDEYGNNKGIKISCVYLASGTTQELTITPSNNNTFHLYAMTNRESSTNAAAVNLDGAASDADGDALTAAWTVVSGPASVVFTNASAEDTTATFAATGTYVLRLTANDGELSSSDDLTVTVNGETLPPTVNEAPSVTAGNDTSITLPANTVSLNGTVSDDGLPGTTLATVWSKISGPGTVNFANNNNIDTTATFGSAGTYVLQSMRPHRSMKHQ
jgi:hypothetical protein